MFSLIFSCFKCCSSSALSFFCITLWTRCYLYAELALFIFSIFWSRNWLRFSSSMLRISCCCKSGLTLVLSTLSPFLRMSFRLYSSSWFCAFCFSLAYSYFALLLSRKSSRSACLSFSIFSSFFSLSARFTTTLAIMSSSFLSLSSWCAYFLRDIFWSIEIYVATMLPTYYMLDELLKYRLFILIFSAFNCFFSMSFSFRSTIWPSFEFLLNLDRWAYESF